MVRGAQFTKEQIVDSCWTEGNCDVTVFFLPFNRPINQSLVKIIGRKINRETK